MSAESPRRGIHKGAQVISPQPVSDRSIIESVAGIINDIVPQAYTGTPNVDNKESITWARFEYADVNDPALYPDYNEGSSTPPLLLVLGYGTGVQVWLISASGEATEVLSWRQGVVRTLRLLPNPKAGNDQMDLFHAKRPMVAICDSAGPGPQFCSIGFISLKTGEQVKSIKFKNPINDVLANRKSVVVTFSEKIAVFDAKTFEDVLTVTTCYLSPGPNSNPVALGTRWLAYSEKKLIPARRSSGGSEGEGAQSYTATVLHAAKSLGKGLRGLGETVASTLTGNSVTPPSSNTVNFDTTQPGLVTVLDLQAAKEDKESDDGTVETVLAHFTAHSDAIVAMTFDLTGALLMTADRRGHDFHIFRIQPHPGGPTLAAVHHLYVLHRGDTTAKVQDMTFSSDARWAAISTVRGTTHVFPVAPYGGTVGIRTHSTPHVVNRLSRFHRSAGLTADGTRSHSPVAHAEVPMSVYPYCNPRLPPYPHPTIIHPLAQIRQPSTLNHVNNQPQPRPQQRQRLQSEDSGSLPLKICSCFAPQRAWLYAQRDAANKIIKRPVDSLFIMACHGNMIQYDLEPKPTAGIPKEKVCDDTTIELDVEAKGQWPLLRVASSLEILPPLPESSPLLGISITPKNKPITESIEDQWLSQVEIVTHAGPHRRLWMGPQFIFKTYNAPSGVAVNLLEAEAVEVGVTGGSRPARSNPVNMPHAATKPLVPLVIDGSGSSYEQSPRFLEAYGDSLENESIPVGGGENQLREDLAEAMLETAAAPHRPGRRVVVERMGQPVAKVVNPLGTVITISADEDDNVSSDSYDTDSTLEPLRSLCAQEGPASLDDFRQELQPIKKLTEICAEMRTTSDSAIDSLANEDMQEVVERKALYAEAARLKSKGTVNFDELESFTDVQMTLNLCVEAGKIPNSPMTQAKESPWNKKKMFTEQKRQEAKIARAKYVVNYDEETIVVTDNIASVHGKDVADVDVIAIDGNTVIMSSSKETNTGRKISCRHRKQNIHTNTIDCKKDLSRLESNFSNVHNSSLEDLPSKRNEQLCHKEWKKTNNHVCDVAQLHQLLGTTAKACGAVKKSQNLSPVKEKTRKKSINKSRDTEKLESSFETIKDADVFIVSTKNLTIKSLNSLDQHVRRTDSGTCNQTDPKVSSEDPLHIDAGVSQISILERHGSFDTHSLSSIHSDEDLEHIHSSETALGSTCKQQSADEICNMGETYNPAKGVIPICQYAKLHDERTLSKTTSSDDDMEHIQSSEIQEEYSESALSTDLQSDTRGTREGTNCTGIGDSRKVKGQISAFPRTMLEDSKCTVQTCGATMPSLTNEFHAIGHQTKEDEYAEVILDCAKLSNGDQTAESNLSMNKGKQRMRLNKSRKNKDDALGDVLAGGVEENEPTLSKHREDCHHVLNKRHKTPEHDLVEEFGRCVDPVTEELTLPRRYIHRDNKLISNESTSLENIEIIDIDALCRAEAECEHDHSLIRNAECRVSELRSEMLIAKPKKLKKSKKVIYGEIGEDSLHNSSHLSLSKLKLLQTEINQRDNSKIAGRRKSETQVPQSSWSSIVKKNKDHGDVEKYRKIGMDTNEFNLEAEAVMTTTVKDLPKYIADGAEIANDLIASVKSNEDRASGPFLDSIVTTDCQVVKNLDTAGMCPPEGDDDLEDSTDIRMDRDIIKRVKNYVDYNRAAESDSPHFGLHSSMNENNISEHDSKQTHMLDYEQNPENASVSNFKPDLISVTTEKESVGMVVATEQLPSVSPHSSKTVSPEAEQLLAKEIDIDRSTAGQEQLTFLDDLNASANLMDTEEDNSLKEHVDKCLGNGSSITKKGRSKKKRRR